MEDWIKLFHLWEVFYSRLNRIYAKSLSIRDNMKVQKKFGLRKLTFTSCLQQYSIIILFLKACKMYSFYKSATMLIVNIYYIDHFSISSLLWGIMFGIRSMLYKHKTHSIKHFLKLKSLNFGVGLCHIYQSRTMSVVMTNLPDRELARRGQRARRCIRKVIQDWEFEKTPLLLYKEVKLIYPPFLKGRQNKSRTVDVQYWGCMICPAIFHVQKLLEGCQTSV